MRSDFLKKFQRITYSTSYLPEIDGLRFLAIFSVVVIMHITHYMDDKFYGSHLVQGQYWRNFIFEGGSGVPLFFVISGFILSLPFAKWRLTGGKKQSLKNYYMRRVFRLEPPYFIALVILFIAQVWLLNKYSFTGLLPHFFASVFYLHTTVYHSFSWVLPVAWSLEVEVQFYILAPLICLLFLIRSGFIRRAIFFLVILVSAIYWYDVWSGAHVFMYLHFFFSGILLADLYCSNKTLFPDPQLGFVAGISSLAAFIFVPSLQYPPGYFLKIACMFVLVHTVLSNPYMKRIFSARIIVVIGGMCYSIYLLHYAVISFTGHLLLKSGISTAVPAYFPVFALMFIVSVLLVSAAYFLLVEKPFMKPMGLKKEKL